MKRNILAAVSAFVLAAAAAGCGSSPQEGNTEGASVESTSEGAEISGASGEVSGSSGEEQGETAGEETRYPLTITGRPGEFCDHREPAGAGGVPVPGQYRDSFRPGGG